MIAFHSDQQLARFLRGEACLGVDVTLMAGTDLLRWLQPWLVGGGGGRRGRGCEGQGMDRGVQGFRESPGMLGCVVTAL